jgi:protein CpxP
MTSQLASFTRSVAVGVFATTLAVAAGSAIAARAMPADRVEMRINDMHAKLHITPDQETQWQQVAQVMRDNENALQPLIAERKNNARNMSAVDDLHSYEKITEAHVEGIKKFTPAFETLYASMSDEQKRQADAMFRGIEHKKQVKAATK